MRCMARRLATTSTRTVATIDGSAVRINNLAQFYYDARPLDPGPGRPQSRARVAPGDREPPARARRRLHRDESGGAEAVAPRLDDGGPIGRAALVARRVELF